MTKPFSLSTILARTVTSAALVIGVSAFSPTTAYSQTYRHDRPHRAERGRAVIVVDRSRPNWWRGHRLFRSYRGPRTGYFYAPGYGYYRIPKGYSGRSFVVGTIVPGDMRRYLVADPGAFGLAAAPKGHAWIFAGNNIALVESSTGLIVRSVPGGW